MKKEGVWDKKHRYLRDYLGDLRYEYGSLGVTLGLAAEAAWWFFAITFWVFCFQVFVWIASIGGSTFEIEIFGAGLGGVILCLFMAGAASVILVMAMAGLLVLTNKRRKR